MSPNYAHKGLAAEQMIEMSNRYYIETDLAVIQKVHTPITVKWRDGAIAGARFTEKSTVDFLGVYCGRAIAFDCKENSQLRWPLRKLEPHQYLFLRRWQGRAGLSFILLHNVPTDSWHVLTLAAYEHRLLNVGYRSLNQEEILALPRCANVPGCTVDYLSVLNEMV